MPGKSHNRAPADKREVEMDLQSLLKKTETRSSKIKGTRTAPSIATEERPYTNDISNTVDSLTSDSDYTELQSDENNSKQRNQPAEQPTTKLQQTHNKVTTKAAFLTLVGLQQKIVLFIYDLCKIQGTRTTEAVSISNIADNCKTTTRAAQETIRRLELKGFIGRVGYKNGRGGWTSYELTKDTYQELFQLETSNKLTTKLQQTPNKLPTELTTQLTTSAPSSSSSLVFSDFKTTTTETEVIKSGIHLDSPWTDIDVSVGEPFQFTRHQLVQLVRDGHLTPKEVSDSLSYFAFDFQNGRHKDKRDPLSYLMKILRTPSVYPRPEDYETPLERSRRERREELERKERQHLAEEKQLIDLEFSEWKRGLANEELTRLVPEFARNPGPIQDSALRAHFDEQVWPMTKVNAVEPKLESLQIRNMISESLKEVSG